MAVVWINDISTQRPKTFKRTSFLNNQVTFWLIYLSPIDKIKQYIRNNFKNCSVETILNQDCGLEIVDRMFSNLGGHLHFTCLSATIYTKVTWGVRSLLISILLFRSEHSSPKNTGLNIISRHYHFATISNDFPDSQNIYYLPSNVLSILFKKQNSRVFLLESWNHGQ